MDKESNQRFNQQATVRTGSLLCWHGQERIARVVNKAGIWTHHGPDTFAVKNMFNENPDNCWHSSSEREGGEKTMRIEFKVSVWSEENVKRFATVLH